MLIMRSVFLLFVVLGGTSVRANDSSPLAGKYVTQNGDLTIKQLSDGKTVFDLVTVSAWNGHICELEGQINAGRAVLGGSSTDNSRMNCVVRFEQNKQEVTVTSNGDICQKAYCGAAVTFEGVYVVLPQDCEPAALKATRQDFQRKYDRKNYSGALTTLQPILDDCVELLNDTEGADIRNDFAITQYRLRDLDGCLRTLEPLREDALKTDAELRELYPQFSADDHVRNAHAARANLRLCGQQGKSGN